MDFLTNHIPLIIALVLAFVIVLGSLFSVQQQSSAIIERFGKFLRVAGPGLNFKIPFIDSVAAVLKHRITELDVLGVNFKTKDNVFLDVEFNIQYRVLTGEADVAFYQLNQPQAQIQAFVLNTARAQIADMVLADVFAHQDAVAHKVNESLSDKMREFGFEISNVLVTEVNPDESVVEAMNQVRASESLAQAAKNQGEATKIKAIMEAEAEAQANKLRGQGMAAQREAIVKGYVESIKFFKDAGIDEVNTAEVLELIRTGMHYEMLEKIGHGDKTKLVVLPAEMIQSNSLLASNLTTSSEQVNPTQEGPRSSTVS